MKTPVASLIISVYNNTRALRAVLDSVGMQSVREVEVIVSEDAEHASMREFLESYAANSPLTIVHMTQPDQGWRKNRALNRAVAAASSPYIIMIDGDCVLHPRFVEFHMKLSQRGYVVAGKRVKLNEALSDVLLADRWALGRMPSMLRPYLWGFRRPKPLFIEEGFFLNPSGILGFIPRMRGMSQLKGCNMSFYRDDLVAINGFDEEYVLPAIGEDIDITWRMLRNGCHLRSARNLAVQYHLYHKENWTDQSVNEQIMARNKQADRFVCQQGISQYL